MYVLKYKDKYVNFGNRFKKYDLVELPELASLFTSLEVVIRRRKDFYRMGMASADDLHIYDVTFSFTEKKVEHKDHKPKVNVNPRESEINDWIKRIKDKVEHDQN